MNLNHIGNCPDCGGQGLLEIVRTYPIGIMKLKR
jgi:hypothetical protein